MVKNLVNYGTLPSFQGIAIKRLGSIPRQGFPMWDGWHTKQLTFDHGTGFKHQKKLS